MYGFGMIWNHPKQGTYISESTIPQIFVLLAYHQKNILFHPPPKKKSNQTNETSTFFEIHPPFSRQNPRKSAPSFVALLKGTKISSRKPAPKTCSTWRRSACNAFDVKVNQGESGSSGSSGSEPAVWGLTRGSSPYPEDPCRVYLPSFGCF